ncbi:MAG: C39 family peptidase [bacterium]|nr:C39 family peptidase [bacterium]
MLYKQSKRITFFKYILLVASLIQVSSTHTHRAKQPPKNNHIELNIPFISQMDQTYLPYTSCVPACVMMMLLYRQQNTSVPTPAYKKLCVDLKTSALYGTYFENVYSYFSQNNWHYSNAFENYHDLATSLKQGPITVCIELKLDVPKFCKPLFTLIKHVQDYLFGNISHAVVLIGANEQGFIYLDPLYRKRRSNYKKFISYQEFGERWNGIACQLLM